MKTIYKYLITPYTTLLLPRGFSCLEVGVQDDEIYLWVLVDPAEPTVEAKFVVYATGQPIDRADEMIHIGTVQMPPFVWHVFWLPK